MEITNYDSKNLTKIESDSINEIEENQVAEINMWIDIEDGKE